MRDPIDIVNELEYLITNYNIPRITFVDDTFASNSKKSKAHAYAIADEMARRKLYIPFMIDTRIDCIDRQLFNKLYDVGLDRVFLGLEATDQKTLDLYNKHYKIGDKYIDIRKQVEILKSIGIEIVYGVIPLNPSTTINELESNIDFLHSLPDADPFQYMKPFIPFPGVYLTKFFIKNGKVLGDFPNYYVQYDDKKVFNVLQYYNALELKYNTLIISLNGNFSFYSDDQNRAVTKHAKQLFYNYLKSLIKKAQEGVDLEELNEMFNDYNNQLLDIINQYGSGTMSTISKMIFC